jgi:hypothetical protein
VPEQPSDYALAAVAHVQARATGGPLPGDLRVTLNFHPDRSLDGVPILDRLARDGVYLSQFETGTSNGGLTAHPGGSRWRWEQRIFGGAYDQAPPAERPKYGALNHRSRTVGAAPRFGSAHFRLAPHTRDRTTFCFPDSAGEPEQFGTAERFDLVGHLDAAYDRAIDDDHEATTYGWLDHYVEAHVHGVVRVGSDVEALVLDPCYRGTPVEDSAHRLDVPVEWHEGFRVDLDTVRAHPRFRGPEVVALAEEVAVDGWLDPNVVGDAAATGRHDPQTLKKVWHYTARFGWAWDVSPA